jgi:hypothetical protein
MDNGKEHIVGNEKYYCTIISQEKELWAKVIVDT